MSVLQIDGLGKSYGGNRALHDLNLNINAGEILALLGPTGAGKTSTLMCIAGLTTPDYGEIKLIGNDVTHSDPRLRDVAIVFEGFNLLPILTAYDNIALPLRSPIYRQTEDVVDARVQKAAADLKIGHLLERNIDQLSGGERQRVAVARALVRDPVLYLLDEPLSALDLKLRESLRAELKALQREHAATILYATHDYHGAAAIADRIALIDAGRIIQIGALDELISNPSHASVGQLIGSPSMALFPASLANGVLSVDGYTHELAVSANTPAADVLVGWWPEDIVLTDTTSIGLQQAQVYATDFRGIDRAVQVKFGPHSFRKVVPHSFTLTQGDACWFGLDPEKVYLFDPETRERIYFRRAPTS
jgi:multiple sugar transport system ATP-binding protein